MAAEAVSELVTRRYFSQKHATMQGLASASPRRQADRGVGLFLRKLLC
jgi:hypothetical protein